LPRDLSLSNLQIQASSNRPEQNLKHVQGSAARGESTYTSVAHCAKISEKKKKKKKEDTGEAEQVDCSARLF
jgi:hypothetical protein